MSTEVKYQITIAKSGTGATEAAAEFKSLEQTAARANTTMAANTAVITNLGAATKTASSTFKAMQGTLTLIGLQTFPQLTLAATTAKTAFDGVKTAAAAAGTSVVAMSGQLAVLTLGVYAVIRALQELYFWRQAKGDEKAAEESFVEQTETLAARLRQNVQDVLNSGRIGIEEAGDLAGKLDGTSPEGNRAVQTRLRQIAEQVRAEKELIALQREAFLDTLGPGGREAMEVHALYKERMDKIDDLRKRMGDLKGQEDPAAAIESVEAAYAAMQVRLAETTATVGQLQEIGRKTGEMFAGEFSNAIVNAFRQGRFEAKQFFSDMAAQISQMLLQLAIMRILFGATGLSSGTGGLIGGFVNGAAQGGMFPRLAASGLTGVESVSSPTYLPRFNVLAGEAGREMLTVLARPRMMEVGGMQAMVGSAQGNQLAITNANDLARRGADGVVKIQVALAPGLQAQIIENSIQGAVVQVAKDMRADSPISRGIRQLSS